MNAAVAEVRGSELPLGERLRFIAERVRVLRPAYTEAVEAFVARLARAGAGTTAPQVGEVMPDFMLPDHDGRMVRLDALLEKGPAVVVFHRGHWCPYCRVTLAAIAEVEARIAPHALVAISPERQQYTRSLRADAGAKFAFLSDVGGGYALSLNLAVWVDDAMAALLGNADIDLAEFQGGGGWFLPIPAVFVVGTDQRIIARHIDPDYRRRMALDALLGILERVEPA
ncbi:hypothetical protein IP88_14125 [alpha proteobacterium AAP81b]|nr:hypothetical protein IP88_14125 [alpha proteobacterium AAP81b]